MTNRETRCECGHLKHKGHCWASVPSAGPGFTTCCPCMEYRAPTAEGSIAPLPEHVLSALGEHGTENLAASITGEALEALTADARLGALLRAALATVPPGRGDLLIENRAESDVVSQVYVAYRPNKFRQNDATRALAAALSPAPEQAEERADTTKGETNG